MLEQVKSYLKMVKKATRTTEAPLQMLRRITNNNPLVEFVFPFFDQPDMLEKLSLNHFLVSEERMMNLPLFNNDLKNYLIEIRSDRLEKKAKFFREADVNLEMSRGKFKSGFLKRNMVLLKNGGWENVAKSKLYSLNDYEVKKDRSLFRTADPITEEMEEMERKRLKLQHVSEYWKENYKQSVEFILDLQTEHEDAKYGLKYMSETTKRVIRDKKPNVPPVLDLDQLKH